jgi:branched-chain amino acid transport system permease protein
MGQELVEAVVLGVLTGSVYGLFSVGLSLVYGVMRLVNFAYGDLVAVGMYVAYSTSTALHTSLYIGLVFGLLGAIPAGAILYLGFFRGAEAQHRSHDQLLISLGLSVLLENGLTDIYGSTPVASTNGVANSAVHIGPIGIPDGQLIAFAVACCLTIVAQVVLMRTRTGRALRALVADREMATMLGIRTSLMFGLAFIASVALAAVAGVILFGYLPASPAEGQGFILLGFVCVILGGVGDTRGAFLAGILVGVIESLTTTFWNPQLQDTTVYIVFLLVITLRPRGLLGTAVEHA